MSYIQNNLQAGEEIKYKADIHWYIFAYPVILLLLSVFFSSAQTGFFHYVSLFLLLSGLFQLIKRILPVFLLVNISFLIKYFLLVLVVSRICNPYNFFLSLFGKLVYAIRLLLGGYPRSYKNSRFRSQ